jgi:hypothetical protein
MSSPDPLGNGQSLDVLARAAFLYLSGSIAPLLVRCYGRSEPPDVAPVFAPSSLKKPFTSARSEVSFS